VLLYTLYPVAPVTDDQLTVMLVADAGNAVTPVGVAGIASVIVTLLLAVLLPLAVVAVIVAVPAARAVTVPPDTEATFVLLLLHVKFWFVAFEGIIAAVRFSVAPTLRLMVVLLRDTPVTGTLSAATVTVQEAVLPPSTVVTVIVAVPLAIAVTLPLVDTVATALLLLCHVTFWLVALDGVIVALRVSVLLIRMLVDDFKETPVTAMLLDPVGVLGVLGVAVVPLPVSVEPFLQAAREKPIAAMHTPKSNALKVKFACFEVFFITVPLLQNDVLRKKNSKKTTKNVLHTLNSFIHLA